MKKNKLPLRFAAILMSCIMMFGMPISAFAAEPVENNDSNRIEMVLGPNETAEIDLQELYRSGDAISTSAISSGQSGSANGYLDSYVGLYKTIHFSAIYQNY